MAEYDPKHPGDFVQGNKSAVIVNQGPFSTYIEVQTIQYIDHTIQRLLAGAPFVPDVFEGRDADYDAVDLLLHADRRPLLLLNGEGGIGKTTLAAYYWQRQLRNYQHFAWLYVQGSVENALLGLAPALHVHAVPGEPQEATLARLITALGNLAAPSLLVLDNVNDPGELQLRYPALAACTNLHVLYTTRCAAQSWAKAHPVAPLDKATALVVFRKHFPAHRPEEDALFAAVYDAVGGNTLVLELLAKNLARINRAAVFYPLAQLVEDLQGQGLLALREREKVALVQQDTVPRMVQADPEDVIRALYGGASMPHPLSEAERFLLSNFAVLPAESLAYEDFKRLLAIPQEVARRFAQDLETLAERGWIEGGHQGAARCYRISPVVQHIIRAEHVERLLGDVEGLVGVLAELLKYQVGTGTLENIGPEEAVAVIRWSEAVVGSVGVPHQWCAVLCERIGRYHMALGFLARGLGYYEQKIKIAQTLVAAEPENLDYRNSLAISYERLGETYAALGQLDTALGHYQKVTDLFEELHAAHPGHLDFKNGLAISYTKLGEAYAALGQLDTALGHYLEFNRLSEELYAAHPGHVAFKNGLAVSYEKLGETYAALGQLDAALGHLKEGHRLSEEMHAAFPRHVDFKHGLAISYSKLGETYAALGQLDAALEHFKEYLCLSEELHAAFPGHVDFKHGLAISYSKLGETYAALGQFDAALEYYLNRNRLGEELHAAFPGHVDFKNGLAISYAKLAQFARDIQNDPEAAKAYFQQAERLWAALVHDAPAFVEYQRHLTNVRSELQALEG